MLLNSEVKKFLCTHGGLPLVPKLTLVSAKEMIHGVGKYETEIGEIYSENYKKRSMPKILYKFMDIEVLMMENTRIALKLELNLVEN